MIMCPFTLEELEQERESKPCKCGKTTISRLTYFNDKCACGRWAIYSAEDEQAMSDYMEWLDNQQGNEHHETFDKNTNGSHYNGISNS